MKFHRRGHYKGHNAERDHDEGRDRNYGAIGGARVLDLSLQQKYMNQVKRKEGFNEVRVLAENKQLSETSHTQQQQNRKKKKENKFEK